MNTGFIWNYGVLKEMENYLKGCKTSLEGEFPKGGNRLDLPQLEILARRCLELEVTGKRKMVFAEPDGNEENKHGVIQLSLMKFVQFLTVSTSPAFMSASQSWRRGENLD